MLNFYTGNTLKSLFFALVIGAASIPTYANTKTISITEKLANIEKETGVRLGISATNTANKQTIRYKANELFPFQSTFKLIVAGAILKQSMQDHDLLQQKMTYTKDDLVFWSPITEKHVTDGMSILDLSAAAMMYSDNTATNLLMKKLGDPKAVTAFARTIGDTTFSVSNWEPNLNSNPNDHHDTSTPAAMEKSLQKLTLGNALAPAQRTQLVDWMKGNTTGDTRIRAGVPKGWIVADKTGAGDGYGISNDIGIVWAPKCAPIVMAIYSIQDNKDATRRDDAIVLATQSIIQEFALSDSCLKAQII